MVTGDDTAVINVRCPGRCLLSQGYCQRAVADDVTSCTMAYGRERVPAQLIVEPVRTMLCESPWACARHNHTYCPVGCYPTDNSCEPSASGYVCGPSEGWKCPAGCSYAPNISACLPNSPGAICAIVPETLQCPQNCRYVDNLFRCVPNTLDNVCELKWGPQCPAFCRLAPDGTCYQDRSEFLCRPSGLVRCNIGCDYDPQRQRCVPVDVNSVCEPTTILTCPPRYIIVPASPIPACDRWNKNRACSLNTSAISSPITDPITAKCNFTLNPYSGEMTMVLGACPDGCKLKPLENKCDGGNATLCGLEFAHCPKNYIVNSQGICSALHSPPKCEATQNLFYLRDYTGHEVYPRCVDRWYFP